MFIKYFTTVCMLLLCCSTPLFAQLDTCIVSYVVDGDTFYGTHNGVRKKYRLIGIDTPELAHHGKVGQLYAEEAKLMLEKLIKDKPVLLEYDIQTQDRYRRELVYVFMPDTIFVNEALIVSGLANLMTIAPNVKYSEVFYKKLQIAKKEKMGMWK